MADPASMFDKLTQNRQKAKVTPTPSASAGGPQATAAEGRREALRPELYSGGGLHPQGAEQGSEAIAGGLEGDFSDLVTELLEEWLER